MIQQLSHGIVSEPSARTSVGVPVRGCTYAILSLSTSARESPQVALDARALHPTGGGDDYHPHMQGLMPIGQARCMYSLK